ncbi:MAG: methylenetetrahydrofolate--tRNA-(uracil(54)-C(5))-methyltransferase (FADH(2)-oxidizing) TrmFO [Saccharofermentanales bacterium]
MGITVVGAGLAGCEAAYQIARFGIPVTLIDMKPVEMSPAHKSADFAELVCSNSLKADRVISACGLLKEEMRRIGSLLLDAAQVNRIPAGGALAVDREGFSGFITQKIRSNPFIHIETDRVDAIPADDCVIIATGPLTSGLLFDSIRQTIGTEELYFYDAAAPVIESGSIDMDIAFRQSRYQRGGDDYINCPMDESQYKIFISELVNADHADLHEFESLKVFEGCMPIESMASRGEDTLRFGPMKPVGLLDPATGKRPYACIQLRQDNFAGTLYSPVGFQTRLRFKEQQRVFRMIPGLEKAEFVKFGVMHRNTYIHSPGVIDATYMAVEAPGLYFAGQITGVEGYVESMASGMLAGIHAAIRYQRNETGYILPATTMMGALSHYISDPAVKRFQPMNANFGILPSVTSKSRISKEEKYTMMAERSLAEIDKYVEYLNLKRT